MRLKAAIDEKDMSQVRLWQKPDTALGAPTGGTFIGISCLSGRTRGHVMWCAFSTFPFLVSLTTYRQNQHACRGRVPALLWDLQHESKVKSKECSGSVSVPAAAQHEQMGTMCSTVRLQKHFVTW